MKCKLIALLAGIALIGCGGHSGAAGPDEPLPVVPTELVSPNNRVIYEVNVRSYSAAGTFAAVKNDLPRLKELGVDILWLMPIHPVGQQNHNGTLGSPYSVRDYKAVNPAYGTLTDLKELVQAAHDKKMEVWLDWVGNHTSWDNAWVTEHLDYYAEKDGVRPYSPEGWNDVIQLDYNNANMRAAMIDAMSFWVKEANIDGFRCDAASYIPLSFWREARAAINPVKNITWLAEGEKPEYMDVFDYDYAWDFNNRLNTFGTDRNVQALSDACKSLFNNTGYSTKGRMVFLTNHDLNAYSGTEFARYGTATLPLTVLEFTIYDMPLIYNGQEIGMNKSIGLFDNDKVAWTPVNQTMSTLIKKMIALKRSSPALESGSGRGTLSVLGVNNSNVLAYSRKKGDSEVVVLLNFGSSPLAVRLSGNLPTGEFTDYLKGGKLTFSADAMISLPANGYAVYTK